MAWELAHAIFLIQFALAGFMEALHDDRFPFKIAQNGNHGPFDKVFCKNIPLF